MSQSADQDRTERATPKREREAREKGQIARSRELATAVLVAGGALLLLSQGESLVSDAARVLHEALQITPDDIDEPADLSRALGELLRAGLIIAAPLLALGFFGALAGPLLLGGWNLSVEALKPQFSRLDPIAGLGRIFSTRALFDLGLGLVKVAVLGGIAATVLWSQRDTLVSLSSLDVLSAIGALGGTVMRVFGWLALGLAVIAALDVPWQVYRHGKDLRMTKQEIKEEYKQAEGRPEVKGKIRHAQQALARRRMMDAVPTADVIVTNPTHYAVALKYSADRMRAPKVVAKGADVIAAAIRDLARQHRVPIVSAPPLARALYRSVDLDREIPAPLFQAVAQVLSYVYQLRNWRGGTPPPKEPDVGTVPGGEPDPQV